jgi:hypothetical protein
MEDAQKVCELKTQIPSGAFFVFSDWFFFQGAYGASVDSAWSSPQGVQAFSEWTWCYYS